MVALLVALPTSAAMAQQFVVTDVTYTHSAATTSDSHYRVAPRPGSPQNWKSPVDYASGSAHVLLEVKSKPTATPTKFQVCFEASPSYCCTAQSVAYTEPGIYEWTTSFSDFYFGGDVDFSKGINKVALILKDTANGKPQGDPNYVPTDLHVEVTIMAPGVSYVPPVRDAGVAPDASVSSADAGLDAALPPGAGEPEADASRLLDAGSSATPDAGRTPAGPDPSESGEQGMGQGCSLAASTRDDSWLALAILLPALLLGTRRRR